MSTELAVASIGRRIGAAIIDVLVMTVFVWILFYDPLMALATLANDAATPQARGAFALALQLFQRQTLPYIFALYITYHAVLVWQNGMTVGKYFAKIRVVPLDPDRPMTFTIALARALGRTLGEMFLFYLTFFPAFFSPLRQTLHDRLGRTVVINMEPRS